MDATQHPIGSTDLFSVSPQERMSESPAAQIGPAPESAEPDHHRPPKPMRVACIAVFVALFAVLWLLATVP
jgi:hypothetical protein